MPSGTFSRPATRHVVCRAHEVFNCRTCLGRGDWMRDLWPVQPALVLPFPTNELPPRVRRAAVTQTFAGTFPERREAWAWGD